MTIGLVVPGGVDPSGRERVVPVLLWLIERLARRHDVHVFVVDYFARPCTYRLAGATVHDLGRVTSAIGLRRFAIARRLERALREHGPFDVLHAYWGVPAGIATARVARRLGVPAVVTLTGGELVALDDIAYGSQRRWIDRRAIDRTIRDAAAVTVPTDYMARQPALAGIRPEIIPTGVDLAAFRSVERPEGPPWRLVRVASISRVKDYPTLLHAIRQILDGASEFHDIHLDIVGEDTLGGSMQALAARLGLDRHVTFHGFQPSDRLPPFYGRAHLNVVSSRHEASNVTMVEAACMELPTVGSAVGHVADWHPARAVAVAPDDPPALAGAIVDLLGDRDRRLRLGRAARAWAVDHDADWTAAEFERLYARVVTPRPLPAR
jgi:glycosyltransferase involved in cell wall biosynthesis